MISIIIPAFNTERTIERCLESIFAQKYQDSEVIVVDDGSTDRTRKILQDFSRKFTGNSAQFTVVEQENRGANAARNHGFRELSNPTHPPSPGLRLPSPSGRGEGEGQYVLFCDADIVLRRDCLTKMMRALEEHPEASYAYASFKFGWKKFKLWPFDAERLRQMPYIHTTSLIRRSVIEEIQSLSRQRLDLRTSSGPFDESVKRLQDWDLWLTMLEQGYTGVWIPEVLFQVINTRGTMSSWLPALAYKLPKWLGFQPTAVVRYNEAVARIKAKHNLV